MFISNVELREFGPFTAESVQLAPNAINVIEGPNASGKTQFAGAILAALEGPGALCSKGGSGLGRSCVTLDLVSGNVVERVILVASPLSTGKVSVDISGGELASAVRGVLRATSGQRLLLSAWDIGGQTRVDLASARELLPIGLLAQAETLQFFEQASSPGGSASFSAGSIAVLIEQLRLRRQSPLKLPLLVDDVCYKWSGRTKEIGQALLQAIAAESQVIVFTHQADSQATYRLQRPEADRKQSSAIWFDNEKLRLRQRTSGASTRRQAQAPAPRWPLGGKLAKQESRTCEYKEVKGDRPLNSIKAVVDQYVVAFLNEGHGRQGSIFWGVRDEDHSIVGVRLSRADCDELRRVVTERLHQIFPPIAPSAYTIEVHSVSDEGAEVTDLYVVEVRVPSAKSRLLYSTGGQEVYIKTDSGKRRLNPLEIQKEFALRNGLSLDQ